MCEVHEGSARETVENERGIGRKKKKKEGGDYRRLLSRIRLVIIVISSVRNARVRASVCVKHEKRERGGEGEKRKRKEIKNKIER